MEKLGDSPVLSVLASAESIYKLRNNYRFALYWSMALGIWLIGVIGISILFAIFHYSTNSGEYFGFVLSVGIAGVFFIFTTPLMILYAWRGSMRLSDFLNVFNPLWLRLKIEMASANSQDAVSVLTELVLSTLPFTRRSKVIYHENVESASESDYFNVCVKKRRNIALIKKLSKCPQITANELKGIKLSAQMMASQYKSKLTLLLVLSEGAYETECIKWADSPEGLRKLDSTCVLISETDHGLRVTWMTTETV